MKALTITIGQNEELLAYDYASMRPQDEKGIVARVKT